jgi:hypothetical protein
VQAILLAADHAGAGMLEVNLMLWECGDTIGACAMHKICGYCTCLTCATSMLAGSPILRGAFPSLRDNFPVPFNLHGHGIKAGDFARSFPVLFILA